MSVYYNDLQLEDLIKLQNIWFLLSDFQADLLIWSFYNTGVNVEFDILKAKYSLE